MYTCDLQSKGVRLVGLLLPNGQRVRGDLQLTAKGAGNINSPEGTVDLDVNALELDSPVTSASTGDESVRTAQLGRVIVMAVVKNNEATITASSDRFNLDADAVHQRFDLFDAEFSVRRRDCE